MVVRKVNKLGWKSRGSYSVGICLKSDCVNRRPQACSKCHNFSYYLRRPTRAIGKLIETGSAGAIPDVLR